MFVADLHNDLVQRMMIGEDVTTNTSSGHTDIERLKLSPELTCSIAIWLCSSPAITAHENINVIAPSSVIENASNLLYIRFKKSTIIVNLI